MVRLVAVLLMALAAASCSSRPAFEDTADYPLKLVLEEYLSGKLTAWGLFQDRFGTVRRSFIVDIEGRWDGQTLTLTEDFVYEDKTEEQRIWQLTKTGDNNWSGTAQGVTGKAEGKLSGNAFNWHYTIDLETPDGVQRVSFDDWMWLQDDRTLINRAYMTKYGIDIGEVIIFFRRDGS